jgi:hypothetical protein
MYGLNFSSAKVVVSFFIPIRNLYEPVKLLKTIWKASEPNVDIVGSKWKNIDPPSGLTVWWILVIAAFIGEVHFVGSIEILNWINDTFVQIIFTPLASISTILIVRKINLRIDAKRKLQNNVVNKSIPINPLTNQVNIGKDKFDIKRTTLFPRDSTFKDLTCNKCNSKNPQGSNYCQKCGSKFINA